MTDFPGGFPVQAAVGEKRAVITDPEFVAFPVVIRHIRPVKRILEYPLRYFQLPEHFIIIGIAMKLMKINIKQDAEHGGKQNGASRFL